MNTRPLLSYVELSSKVPAKAAKGMKGGRTQTPNSANPSASTSLSLREMVRIALDQHAGLPILKPYEHEMLMYAMQEAVWQSLSSNASLWSDDRIFTDDLDAKNQPSPRANVFDAPYSGQRQRLPRDVLDFSSCKNIDETNHHRLCDTLIKCMQCLVRDQTPIQLKQERDCFLSAMLSYYTAFLRLNAPLNQLHSLPINSAKAKGDPVKRYVISCELECGCLCKRSGQACLLNHHFVAGRDAPAC